MLKKRINTILEILRLSKEPFLFLGSYNNNDFDYFSDVDVDLIIEKTKDLPQKIKSLLDRIKQQGPNLGFKFLELKFGEGKKLKNINASIKTIENYLINCKKIKLDIFVEAEPNFTIEIVYKFKQPTLEGFINVNIRDLMDDIDKQKEKGDWMKVAKRLYSITKLSDDEARREVLVKIIDKYLRDVWLVKTLELPQNKSWINYVKSKNININKIQDNIKNELQETLII